MQAGATVIDALPHGNYFHVTAKLSIWTIAQRMHTLAYEAMIGLTMTIAATVMYIIF